MKTKRIYIIDDDKLTVKLMSMLLHKNQFCDEIHSFFNAQSALEELKKNSDDNDKMPDGILLDLNMPVMDGWQFLDEFVLLAIKKEISIFIVTSSIDPADIQMAKKHHFLKDYIMKPITAEKLKAMSEII
ncbi:response regulator [Flavobacterium sp. XN-5]|uniref:Response regulator n=1 Tax=Flavobacterium hiemivividum TaxID=2541734 RepID=A0A4R5CQE9_9FLAO|nr:MULTISPECIES: response regulator [Flavobacterium]NGY38361.1 response regulator [Flavobacterium sp. XN-5]TDE02376.1 response regulator [Flavobacterium hiemivividum]